MRLILIGCEYAGTTTLAEGVRSWSNEVMGKGNGLRPYHDHWKIPHTSGHVGLDDENIFTPEEQKQFLALTPKAKEMFQRHNITYHVQPDALRNPDYVGDSAWMKRAVIDHIEEVILEFAPTMPLVLVKASPKAIKERMKAGPHHNQVISEDDIGRVSDEFEAEFERSAIGNKLTIDTTEGTPEETLERFLEQFEPHLTESDTLRILTHRASQSGDWL